MDKVLLHVESSGPDRRTEVTIGPAVRWLMLALALVVVVAVLALAGVIDGSRPSGVLRGVLAAAGGIAKC